MIESSNDDNQEAPPFQSGLEYITNDIDARYGGNVVIATPHRSMWQIEYKESPRESCKLPQLKEVDD